MTRTSRQTMRRKIHSVITVCFPGCIQDASSEAELPSSRLRLIQSAGLFLNQRVLPLLHSSSCCVHSASVCFSSTVDQLDYLPALLPVTSPWMPSGEHDLHISTCYDPLMDSSLRSGRSKPAKCPLCRSLCASP